MDYRRDRVTGPQRIRFVAQVHKRRYLRTVISQNLSVGVRNVTPSIGRGRLELREGVQGNLDQTERRAGERVTEEGRHDRVPSIPTTGILNRIKRWVYQVGWEETPEETYYRYTRDLPIESDHFPDRKQSQ